MASNITLFNVNKHYHYTYTLRYNYTHRKITTLNKCNEKHNDRWYKGDKHCIYLEKFAAIKKRASEKNVEKLATLVPFSSVLPIDPVDLPSYKNKFFDEANIYRVFSTKVIMQMDVMILYMDIFNPGDFRDGCRRGIG